MDYKELKDFGIWLYKQRHIDIDFYGIDDCIDRLLEIYLQDGMDIKNKFYDR